MEVLSMSAAAKKLGVHRSTVWRSWRDWGLAFYRPHPTCRRWVISASDLDRYIEARKEATA